MALQNLHDYQKDIENREERYGKSYTDFDKLLRYYDLSTIPDYDNATEPYIGHLFMSRPSLAVPYTESKSYLSSYLANSSDGASDIRRSNLAALKKHPMTSRFINDKYGYAMMEQLSEENPSCWLPIFTTRAMSYSVSDFELKTLDKGATYYGHMIKYGKHNDEHRYANTMSIEFRNDRFLSVIQMIYIWMAYIYIITKSNAISPTPDSEKNGILDYCSSIYYLVTRRDNRELVYWEKLVGCFPLNCPFSEFSYQDTPIIEDRFTINFQYGIKDHPCDPSILMDINYLSGHSISEINTRLLNGWKNSGKLNGAHVLTDEKRPDNYESPFVLGNVYAQHPFISCQKTTDGKLKYYLLYEG